MKLLLADDHDLFREGLAMMLRTDFPNCNIQQTHHWQGIHQCVRKESFDLMILDLFMPRELSWEDELQYLLKHQDKTKICILSASNERVHMQKILNMGIKGYLCKTMSLHEISEALKTVYQGGTYFPSIGWNEPVNMQTNNSSFRITLRQQEVLSLLASGYTNKEIADQLLIKESTIKRHLYNLFQALGANNRVDALQLARQHGLLMSG